MYNNLIFSEFFQSNIMGKNFSKGYGAKNEVLSGENGIGFSDFLRKFQDVDFDFIEAAGMENSLNINNLLSSQDSKEKVISLVAEKMKEALRRASDSSSFVSFSSVEVSFFRKIMVSIANFSGSESEMEEIIGGLENSSTSGAYLPDMLKSIENIKKSGDDIENVFFPFSFIPYFETALESINLEPENIKSTIEKSLDIDKGLSLKDFIGSLKKLKEKAESEIENFTGLEPEQYVEKINGIEIIISVFEVSKSESQEINIDKKAFEKFISAMESRRLLKIDDKDIRIEFFKGSANKKEAVFVKSIANFFVNGDFDKESFDSWRMRERILKNIEAQKIDEDLSFKNFEKSHEYKFFTKILSVEMDMKNYFSDTGDITEKINGKMDFDNIFKEFSDADLDLSEVLESKDFDKLIERSSRKNIREKGLEEVSDLSEKISGEKKINGRISDVSRESRANLQRQLINQIEKQILRTVRIGAKELSFRLNPPDLGKMHLRLESVRNGLNIKIIAEKISTHELLVNKAHEFKQQLQAQGMEVVEVNVELASDFDQAMARERNQNSRNGNNKSRGKMGSRKEGSIDLSGEKLNDRAGFVRFSSNSNLDLRV